ncbi:MAG: amidohydrolase family protein [Spirochaetales bacterium]|jgi:predicted TIM-barrel fold metal-dependent hydrolase|nr:amidohydrolase family protein [Spirochaetales bacterium]
MMIIDSHNHPDWHAINMDKFLANMDEHGIQKTWLLTWECPDHEFDPSYNNHLFSDIRGPIPFARVLSYIERQPDRFVPGYAPDPRIPDSIDRLRAAVSIYGVKIYGELKLRMMFDNPDGIAMYRACGELGLPVVVHIDYEIPSAHPWPHSSYWYGGGIEAFERAVRACPDTVFLGHAPGFWAHISGEGKAEEVSYPEGPVVPSGKVLEMLRTYPNLYCDLSAGSGLNALSRDPIHAMQFIEEFQDRLLFARDYFDGRLMEFLNSLDLSESIQMKIFSENSLQLTHDL